ncbi:MAG TPA: hypothetical protein VMK83_12170 [Gaiellaceae bacterium]|nr:hypothetical protein [Gaiellaceae bacterium]
MFLLATIFAAGLVTAGVVSGAGPLAVLNTDETSTETSTETDPSAGTEAETSEADPAIDSEPTESPPTETAPADPAPVPIGPPTISSDKDDYAPGELVTLSGTNWQPGETVTIDVNDDEGQSWRRNVDIVANEGGEIVDQFNLPDWFVAEYKVTATGEVSGVATTTFTDARVVTTATLNGGASVTVAPGGSITATVTVERDGAGQGVRWESTGWRIATTPPPTQFSGLTCADTPDYLTAGTNTESFTIAAPTTPGTYNAYFIAYNNDTCSPPGAGANAPSPTFTLFSAVTVTVTRQVTFQQSGLTGDTASNAVLTVGANTYTAAQLPVTLTFSDSASVSYSYSTPVSSTTAGKRYVLSSVTGPASPFTVTANTTVTGNYGTQYQLSLATDPAAVDLSNIAGATDGSWHDAGSTVNLTATTPVAIDATSRYRFDDWSGDASGSTNPVGVTMNAPRSVTANYVTQYLLTLETAPSSGIGSSDNPAGSPASTDGFYDAGQVVSVTAEDPVTIDAGSRWRFEEWSGDANGTTNPVDVTMDAAKSVTATYVKQFEVTFTQSGIGSDTGANTVGTIGGSPKAAGNLPVTDWFDEGTAWSFEALVQTDPVSGKRYSLTSATSGTVTSAATITGAYDTQYQLTLATDPAAVDLSNIAGAANGSWHDAGSTVNLAATTPVAIDATSRYRFDDWSGDASGSTNPVGVTMNAPKSVTANYVLQYLLTFDQLGITLATGANTVVTVDGSANVQGVLPVQKWYDVGATATYAYSSPVFTSPASATQFTLAGMTGPTSPITVNGPAAITGNYVANLFTIKYLRPLEQTTDGSVINTGKNGRVIPVKVELYMDGVRLDSSTIPGDVTMRVVGANCAPSTATDPVDEYADAGNSNGNTNLFRWTSEGLIYNLDTKALGLTVNKCYRLDVYIGGTGAIRASDSTYALFKPVK